VFGLPDGVTACLFDMDRVGQAEELRKHGADVVVRDLIELLDADAPAGKGAR
jgi:hypothetical protein